MRLSSIISVQSLAHLQLACEAATIRADQRAGDKLRRRERTRDERVERACAKGAAGYTRDGWPIRPIK